MGHTSFIAHELDVTIVGAGPSGLLTYALLLERGVNQVRCFEAGASLRQGSRATGLKPSSLEVLAQVGMADAVLSRATPISGSHTYQNGVHAAFRPFTEGTARFPANVSLDQRELEGLLLDAVVEHGGEIAWNHTLRSFDPDS